MTPTPVPQRTRTGFDRADFVVYLITNALGTAALLGLWFVRGKLSALPVAGYARAIAVAWLIGTVAYAAAFALISRTERKLIIYGAMFALIGVVSQFLSRWAFGANIDEPPMVAKVGAVAVMAVIGALYGWWLDKRRRFHHAA